MGTDAAPTTEATTRIAVPGRILIVDDDPINRRILTRAFQDCPEVLQAENGIEALNLIIERQPEFVITDLHMPGMDGMQLLTEIRRSYVGAGIPVMVLTSEGQEQALLAAFQRGADDYMIKPFSMQELSLRVSSIYLRQRMARDVNPLTRLPGNMMLKREIEAVFERDAVVAIAYVDLDHFKAFNDYQGFDRGDYVIQLLADLLKEFASTFPIGDVFLGHVGGDDFVLLLPVDQIPRLEEEVANRFGEATRGLYRKEELERGYYTARNRKDEIEQFPLLSVSIGVLTTAGVGMNDLRRVAQVAADVKCQAKKIPGNSVFVDRRTYDE